MRRLILILVGLVGLLLAPALRGDDLYVNNRIGDDKNDGSPPMLGSVNSGPLKTITRALRIAQTGDRIIIQRTEQPYRESLTLQGARNSGTSLMPFRLESDGAIIDGTEPVPTGAWEVYRDNLFRFRPRLMSHQHLYLDGRPAERIQSEFRGHLPDLNPGQWALVDGWIYFCAGPGQFPAQYDLSYCKHQTGITLYEVRHVLIDGLIVQGFQLDGINAHDGVTDAAVQNCTLRGNGRSGLSVGGASRFAIRGSLVGDNNAAQVRSEGFSRLEITDCRLLESRHYGPPIVRDGGAIERDGEPVQ